MFFHGVHVPFRSKSPFRDSGYQCTASLLGEHNSAWCPLVKNCQRCLLGLICTPPLKRRMLNFNPKQHDKRQPIHGTLPDDPPILYLCTCYSVGRGQCILNFVKDQSGRGPFISSCRQMGVLMALKLYTGCSCPCSNIHPLGFLFRLLPKDF